MRKFVNLRIAIYFASVLSLLTPLDGNAQNPIQTSPYVALGQVWSVSRPYLLASGDRLRKPGKERITAEGTISRDQGQPTQVQITWEVPQRIRIDDGRGVIIFDRNGPAQSVLNDKTASDSVETLLEDSVEGFFANHREGSNRFLGTGYRQKGAGSNTPAYDIMEVWKRTSFRGQKVDSVKRYWFDTRTRLLSRVVYFLSSTPIEVFWSDWRDVQGEKIPFMIERKEAGRTTLIVRLSSAVVSPKAQDGLFPGR